MSASRRPPPKPTLRMLVSPRAADDGPDWGDPASTDYELSDSAALPPVTKLRPERPPIVSLLDAPAGRPATARVPLDPDTLSLFRQRLVFCCLIAAVPFTFFAACAATNFIELFGRQTVPQF